tara:strand:- start:2212 stop:3102 length:891 start_codon:yes stop_codon:yes gene_type:complete
MWPALKKWDLLYRGPKRHREDDDDEEEDDEEEDGSESEEEEEDGSESESDDGNESDDELYDPPDCSAQITRERETPRLYSCPAKQLTLAEQPDWELGQHYLESCSFSEVKTSYDKEFYRLGRILDDNVNNLTFVPVQMPGAETLLYHWRSCFFDHRRRKYDLPEPSSEVYTSGLIYTNTSKDWRYEVNTEAFGEKPVQALLCVIHVTTQIDVVRDNAPVESIECLSEGDPHTIKYHSDIVLLPSTFKVQSVKKRFDIFPDPVLGVGKKGCIYQIDLLLIKSAKFTDAKKFRLKGAL